MNCPYKITKSIAEGGYGEVFLVKKNGKSYAYKTFLENKSTKKSFIFNPLEIDIIFRLKSPNLIQGEYISLPGECSSRIGFMTRFIKGDLSNIIRYFNFEKRRKIMFDLVKAVKCLHSNNTLHLDIKLDNVKYDGENAILIDYGMCSYIPYNVSYGIETPQPRFTLDYTSPQGIADKHDLYFYNDKSDIWALGITFMEIIADGYLDFIPSNIYNLYDYYEEKKDIESFFKEYRKFLFNEMNISNIDKFMDKNVFKYCSVKIPEKNTLIDLLKNMLNINDKKRFNIDDILKHPFFDKEDKENICQFLKPINYEIKNIEYLDGVSKIDLLCKSILGDENCYILFMAIDIYLRYITRMDDYIDFGSKSISKNKLIRLCVLISYKYFRWDEYSYDDLIRELDNIYSSEENIIYKVLDGRIRDERYFTNCNNISEVKFLYSHFIKINDKNINELNIHTKYNLNILNYLNNDGFEFMNQHRFVNNNKEIFNLSISNLK